MDRTLVVVFNELGKALDGRDALKRLSHEDDNTALRAYAIVTRRADGTIGVSELAPGSTMYDSGSGKDRTMSPCPRNDDRHTSSAIGDAQSNCDWLRNDRIGNEWAPARSLALGGATRVGVGQPRLANCVTKALGSGGSG
jgi:hypothetical protein